MVSLFSLTGESSLTIYAAYEGNGLEFEVK